MVIMDKKWVMAKEINNEFRKKFPETNAVVLQLLYNREALPVEFYALFSSSAAGRAIRTKMSCKEGLAISNFWSCVFVRISARSF